MRGTFKDITGQRYGKLVAIEPTEKRQGTNVIWRFKCDCGNIVEKVTSHLSSTSSCGCTAWHSLRKDITGQKFGRLTALRPTARKAKGGRIWEFICDCGNHCEVPIGAVTSGNTTSCGCLRSEIISQQRFVDLSGRRFGMLEVVEKSIEKKGDSILWQCKCDCGNTVYYTTNQLNSGAKLNCGCNPNYRFYCVYKHVFPDGRVYVGKTTRLPIIRWQSGSKYEGQYEIYNAIKALGPDKWIALVDHYYLAKQGEWQKWDRSLSFNDTNIYSKYGAEKLEKKWISEYDSTNPQTGLNSSTGGDAGFTFNESTRKRASENMPRKCGPANPSYGKKHSEETKTLQSKIAKERIARTGVVNFKGKHHTEEAKQKLRESHLGKYDGEKNPFYGKHHSDETKEKLSKVNSKPITQYDLSGRRIKTFPSVKAAAETYNTTVSSLSACANKKTSMSNGFIWRYKEIDQLTKDDM